MLWTYRECVHRMWSPTKCLSEVITTTNTEYRHTDYYSALALRHSCGWRNMLREEKCSRVVWCVCVCVWVNVSQKHTCWHMYHSPHTNTHMDTYGLSECDAVSECFVFDRNFYDEQSVKSDSFTWIDHSKWRWKLKWDKVGVFFPIYYHQKLLHSEPKFCFEIDNSPN